MNKILIVFLFIINIVFGQEVKYHTPYEDFEKGSYYYMFGDDVKFRKFPDTNSEVISLLSIGSQIQIISKSSETFIYQGSESNFYKIRYNGQEGYVLGALIAIEGKKIEDSFFFFKYRKEAEDYFVVIRHLDESLHIAEAESKLSTNDFSIDYFNNRGLEDVNNIIYINYLAEACGVDGGGTYFFQEEKTLKKAFDVFIMSDAGVFYTSEEIIFPNDSNGIKGKILYIQESTSTIDEATNWSETKKINRELEWKNGEILPKIKIEN